MIRYFRRFGRQQKVVIWSLNKIGIEISTWFDPFGMIVRIAQTADADTWPKEFGVRKPELTHTRQF